MMLPEFIQERLLAAIPEETPIYLVGGAVRDLLLGRPIHDLDLVVPANALAVARRAADQLGAAYFPLDSERETARLIFREPGESRLVVDIASWRGPDLESDLLKRDFTMNAMALDLRSPGRLIDPLGGAADLHDQRLRACSAQSMLDDPLRTLRAVRLAAIYQLHIEKDTREYIRQAVEFLERVSPERIRDEVCHIAAGGRAAASLRSLDLLGILPHLLPELSALKGITQSPPHILDVWEHTLGVLQQLETLMEVLSPSYDPDKAANLKLGLLVMRLGCYRQQIDAHLNTLFTPSCSGRALLCLAALYHDVAKPQTRSLEAGGRIRFLGHDEVGAQVTIRRGQSLKFSNPEIEHMSLIVRHHLRPVLLAAKGQPPTRRAIYRFFRDTGSAGVDICLLSLADTLAAYGPGMPEDIWTDHLEVVRHLLEAWWENPTEQISPSPLLNGHDLMKRFAIKPGPLIGKLLEAIREAQATGQVRTVEEAYLLVERLLLVSSMPEEEA